MCITFFYFENSSDILIRPYKFIHIFNREENQERSADSLDFWEDDKNILAGRDALAKGTWLGVNIKTGNIAFLTNISAQYMSLPLFQDPVTRGKLVSDFLQTSFFEKFKKTDCGNPSDDDIRNAIEDYVRGIEQNKQRYKGVNLIVGNLKTMVFRHLGNDKFNKGAVKLKEGLHGMTNYPFVRENKKVLNGLALFNSAISRIQKKEISEKDILIDLEQVAKECLKFPYTNFDEVEIVQGKIEILRHSIWATKTTNFILLDWQNRLKFIEVNYDKELNTCSRIVKEAQLKF